MKKTTKKRSGGRKAYEGGYLTGKGAARKATTAMQRRKSRNQAALKAAQRARKGK